jgi:hypothetical protein
MKFEKYFLFIFLSLSIFIFPFVGHAQILFSEIMYDIEGTDSGREWIEIYNSGSEGIDLSGYKLFENNVNHSLTITRGNSTIPTLGYAILADNPEKFLIDNPNFNGNLFDSAFSLNNSGEVLSIKDSSGIIIDTITYDPVWGGNDDGTTLQRTDALWIANDPTAGEQNLTTPKVEEDTDESSDNSSSGSDISTHDEQSSISVYTPKIYLKTSIGRNRIVNIHSPIKFEVEHNQDKSVRLKTIWNMGNGDRMKGRKIEYIFDSVDAYNLVALSGYQGFEAVSRTKVYVIRPDMGISVYKDEIDNQIVYLNLKNNATKETNIGKFKVEYAGKSFIFPENTILSGSSSISISSQITHFKASLDQTEQPVLYYPDGFKYRNER